MAYGVIHHFPGGTAENYEASIGAVHPGPGKLPPHQIFHASGPVPGGWTIMAVYDTKAHWEAFRGVTRLTFHPRGDTLATVYTTNEVRIWDIANRKQIL